MTISIRTTLLAAGLLIGAAGLAVGNVANDDAALADAPGVHALDPVAEAATTLLQARFDPDDFAGLAVGDATALVSGALSDGSTLALMEQARGPGHEAVAVMLLDSGIGASLALDADFETADRLLSILYNPAFMTFVAEGDDQRRGAWNAVADALEAVFEADI